MNNKFTTTIKNVRNANKLAAENEQLKLDNKRTTDQRNVAAGAAGGIAVVGFGVTAAIKRKYTKKLAAETEERLRTACFAAKYYLKACKTACDSDDRAIKNGEMSESDKAVLDNKADYEDAKIAFKEAKAAYAVYTGHQYDEEAKPATVPAEKKSLLKKLNPFKKKAPAPAHVPGPAPSVATKAATETVETAKAVETTTEATAETTETSTTETAETTETVETSTTEATEKEVK